MNSNFKYNLPIQLIVLWFISTFLIFLYGPYEYTLINPVVFYLYLLVILLVLYFGYKRGIKSKGRDSNLKYNYILFVKYTILISVIYLIAKLVLSSGGNLKNLFLTFNDTSEAYLNNSSKKSTFSNYLDIFFNPISTIAFTNGIVLKKYLPKKYFYGSIFLILVTITNSIATATRSGIVGLIFMITATIIIKTYSEQKLITFRSKIKTLVLVLLLLISFMSYFSFLSVSRSESIMIINPVTGKFPKQEYVAKSLIPEALEPLTYSFSFYLSHSYYRLNQAMNLPVMGLGFGLSNSYFIMDNIEELTGSRWLKDMSYGIRLDNKFGGDRYGLYWSTILTWFASDFTFVGLIPIVFFIGYLLSVSLKDSINYYNPLAISSFCILFYLIIHFIFNNPMQDAQGIVTTFVIPLIWYITRKRKLHEGK